MSEPLEKSIIIDILTTLESQGLDAAVAKFKDLQAQQKANSAASGEHAESMDRVRSKVSGATSAIAGMERVASGGTGAIDGMTQAAKGMMAVLGTAGKSMVSVTVASAIAAALVGLIQRFKEAEEAKKAAEKELSDLKVSGALEGLEKYRAALKEATDQANALAEANRGLEDAKLKLGLADIEARKAAELKDPKLTDDQRREIELRYAKEEIQLRNDAAEKRAAQQAKEAKNRIETNAAEIKGLQETRAEIAGPMEENRRWLDAHPDTKNLTAADIREAERSVGEGLTQDDISTMREALRRREELAAQEASGKPKLAELDAQIKSKGKTGEALKLDEEAAKTNVDAVARERKAEEERWTGDKAARAYKNHMQQKQAQDEASRAADAAAAEQAAAREAALSPADRLRRAQGMVSDQRAGWTGRPGGDVGRATGAAARSAIAEAGAAIAAGGDDKQIVGQLMAKLKEMGAVILKGNSALASELDAMDGVIGELQAQVATLKSQNRHGRTP